MGEHRYARALPYRGSARLILGQDEVKAICGLDRDSALCMDVLRQLKAVTAALEGAGDVILRGHLEAHLVSARERGDETEIVDELMEALKYR